MISGGMGISSAAVSSEGIHFLDDLLLGTARLTTKLGVLQNS